MRRREPVPTTGPLRAAVVGCGGIGSRRSETKRMPGILSHAEAYAASPDTDLVGLADADEEALRRAGRLWNVTDLHHDVAGLARAVRPHIVSICTPDDTHARLVREAIEAGIPAILCEKPLATDVRTAAEVAALARASGTVLAVNYTRRYDPLHRQVRDRLLAGEIGALRHVTGWYTKGIVHNGTHLLDTLRFLCGEIEEVRGMPTGAGPADGPTPAALLRFAGGATGYLHGCDARDFTIFEIDLLGTAGRFRLIDQGHALECFVVGESPYYPDDRELLSAPAPPAVGLRDALLHAVADTARALRTGRPPACTAEDAVRALELAHEILRHAAQMPPAPSRAGRRG